MDKLVVDAPDLELDRWMPAENFLTTLEKVLIAFGDKAWGTPLLVLMLGGGLFFLIYSRFLPYAYFRHAIDLIRGRYDDPEDPGDWNHFQALCAALAATIGMGNIAGVAVAISVGGPGAIFWMWISALIGTATKFFTCSLAVMYRGRDGAGHPVGGPMYFITVGLGRRFKPLAIFFSAAGIFACLPLFVANQLSRILNELFLINIMTDPIAKPWQGNLIAGSFLALITGIVIFGGVRRIGKTAERLVPAMVLFYGFASLYIIVDRADRLPEVFGLILSDAFSGRAVAGGSLGAVIMTGVRRAAFSNEAGIGTEALAHGAARTREPIREGLTAMLGPLIDTILVCTMTAAALLLTDVWKTNHKDGIELTMAAFHTGLPAIGGVRIGKYVLGIVVLSFGLSTMFSYSYYGAKCLNFLSGHRLKYPAMWYNLFYVASIIFGSLISVRAAVGFLDGAMALMAIPTVSASILLAPRVMAEARRYFASTAIFRDEKE